jgi:hypothetical protein
VQEAIGGILATVAVPFLTKIMEWFNGIGGVDGVLELLRKELDRIKPYLPEIAGVIGGMLVPASGCRGHSAGEFLLTLAPWAALGALVVIVAQKMGISWDDVKNALMKLKPFVDDAIDGAKGLYQWYKESPTVQFLVSPLAALLVTSTALSNRTSSCGG